ncbi:MAG: FHA domain-containing protein [Myxococcota bacterium]
MIEVEILGDPPRSYVVARPMMSLGRASQNDVVLPDPRVSGQHVIAWVEGDAVWIRDLGSANGTWLDEQRVRGPERVPETAVVRLGPDVRLRLRLAGRRPVAYAEGLVVEDVATGTRIPIRSDRLAIGAGADADLVLPDGPARAATLLVYPNAEVWLGTDEDDRPLALGESFRVGERELRLVRVTDGAVATVVPAEDRYPYRLTATLDGPRGPEAQIEHARTGARHVVTGTHKPVLLYLLARGAAADRKAGLGPEDCGWRSDDEIQAGIWGRHGDDNKLYVLVHRLRAELKAAGFDPWFLEKRQRLIRARVAEAVLPDERSR